MKPPRAHTYYKRASVLLALFVILSFGATAQDSLSVKALSAEPSPKIRQHSPNTALILSAILPGAGQVYNHQAWKVPIVYAGLCGVGYYTYYNYNLMSDYKQEYLFRVNHEGQYSNPDLVSYPTANIYNMYQAYNKTFQLSVIISVAVYGLNLLDAYISGHLFDFEMNDDLSLNIAPSLNYQPLPGPNHIVGFLPTPSMGLTLRF